MSDGNRSSSPWRTGWPLRRVQTPPRSCQSSGQGDGDQRKCVLYFAASGEHFVDLQRRFGRVPGAASKGECVEYRDLHFCFGVAHEPLNALQRLHNEYFNLVLLDLRAVSGGQHTFELQVAQGLALLDAMDSEADIEARYGFHRIVALVSGSSDRVDRLIAALGQRRIGRVIRDPAPAASPEGEPEFAQLALDTMSQMMLERRPGAKALCCAGGGITGIYFEMGALKCLDDCLRPANAINRFDLYFGISAGAVVTSVLANGYTIDDGMAAIVGLKDGPIPPLSLSLFRLGMIDTPDIRDRAKRALRGVASSVWRSARGKSHVSLESLFLDYSDLMGPPLRGHLFERTLRDMFTGEGRTNDFRQLARRLFIGATDQDLRTHVLFGETGWQDVPISQAIQASLSINPAFSSLEIKGRYYCDGAVTNTSHVHEAIRKGADLVLNLDSFVPFVSKEPGYVRRRGFLYTIDQDVRTLSYTRFERAREAALRDHPNVSAYTFLPANSLRKLLSINPMDHRPFLLIWRAAYLSTLRRIHRLRYRMAGDLAMHGLTLDTARADEVAGRLRAAKVLAFHDFFPDGQLQLSSSKTLKLPSREETPHEPLTPREALETDEPQPGAGGVD